MNKKKELTTEEILEDIKTRMVVKDHERTKEFKSASKLLEEGTISKGVFKKILEADRNMKIMTPQEYDSLPSFDNTEIIKTMSIDEIKKYISGPFKMGERSSDKHAVIITGEIETYGNSYKLDKIEGNKHDIAPYIRFNTHMIALSDTKSTTEEAGEVMWSDDPEIIENRIKEISRDIN